jgi:hypothetical protein
MSFATTFISGAGYNLFCALIGFILFHVAMRVINSRNGYTLDKLIQDCRNDKNYNALALLYGMYAIAAALLFGLVIS